MSSYSINEPKIVSQSPSFGVVSAWYGVILIGLTAVSHASSQPVAWILPLIESMRLLLIALILASGFFLIGGSGDGFQWAALPLIINLGTLIISTLVPFDSLWQEFAFQSHWNEFNEVIALVENGRVQPSAGNLALLPQGYEHLSEDGLIMVETGASVTRVFFFTRRQSPWDFSGYLYRSDTTPPQPEDFGGRWQHVSAKRPHWFTCDSW